jgi:uncharacterized protein YdbL (DUF1318 family)
MRFIAALFAAAVCALGPMPAAAQSLSKAIEAGEVGEKFDGYMGVVGAPSPEVRRQVAAVNLRRRNLYIDLSTRRNVSPQLVGMATACELLSKLSPGEAYMLSDGVWRRRAAGQSVPLPDYCR